MIEGAPDQPLTYHQKKNLEKRRLKHLHRQFSEELQSIEQDILQASLNKLKKEAAERAGGEFSDMSDGYLSPADDTESISSDIFGAPDSGNAGMEDFARQRKRNMQLARLDENNELLYRQQQPSLVRQQPQMMPMRNTKARPVTRRSISRELFEERPVTKARPVARRSVSRELFDVNFTPGGGGVRPRKELPDLDSIRRQMRERERSIGRDMDSFCMDKGFSTNFAGECDGGGMDDGGASYMPIRGPRRGMGFGGGNKRPAPHLAMHGRSLTQNDFQLPPSLSARQATPTRRIHEDGDLIGMDLGCNGGGVDGGRRYGAMADGGGRLDLRDRGDWRRVSVPERGQDFKSLPRKYNR